MVFQSRTKEGFGMRTEHPECIPFNSLDSMESRGVEFFVDSIQVSAEQVKEQFKDVMRKLNTPSDEDE